jgi:hypothetical protein
VSHLYDICIQYNACLYGVEDPSGVAGFVMYSVLVLSMSWTLSITASKGQSKSNWTSSSGSWSARDLSSTLLHGIG